MPDDKLKTLYDKIIGTGKATPAQIGDFNTFTSVMSDSAMANKMYDNLISHGVATGKEIGGDFSTFYKYFQPQEPTFDYNYALSAIDNQLAQTTEQFKAAKLKDAEPKEMSLRDRMYQNTERYAGKEMPLQFKIAEDIRPEDENISESESVANQLSYLQTAKDFITIAQNKDKIGTEESAAALGKGLISPLGRDFFTAGLGELARTTDFVRVARKQGSGQPLTENEQTLIDAYNVLQGELQEPGSITYKIGAGASEMVPYLAQFALTRGSGTAVQGGVNKLLKVTARESIKDYVKGVGLRKGAGQIIKEIPGLAAGAAAQSTLMPMTYTAIGEKAVGDQDESGNFINTPGLSEATVKGFAANYPEVFTEVMGGHIISSMGMTGKLLGKKSLGGLTKYLSPLQKVKKAAEFGGFLEETSEELLNNALAPLFDADVSSADLWTAENLITMMGSVALVGGGFYASDLAYKTIDENRLRSKYLSGLPKEMRTNVIGSLKSDDPKEVSQRLTDIISKSGLQPEQAKGILDYAWAESMRKGMSESLFEQNKEIQKRQIEKEMTNQIAPFVFKDGQSLFQVLDNEGNVFWVKDGQININQEDGTWTIGKQPLIVVPMEGGEPKMMAVTDVSSVRHSNVNERIQQQMAQFDQEAEVTKTVTEAAEIVATEKAESITPDLKTGDVVSYNGREAVIGSVSGQSIDAQFTDNDEPVVIPPAEYENLKKVERPTVQPTGQVGGQATDKKVLKAKIGKNDVDIKFTPDVQDKALFTSDNSFSQESDANKVIKSLSDRYSGLEFTAVNNNTDPFAENNYVITAKPKTNVTEVEPIKPQTNEQVQEQGQEVAQETGQESPQPQPEAQQEELLNVPPIVPPIVPPTNEQPATPGQAEVAAQDVQPISETPEIQPAQEPIQPEAKGGYEKFTSDLGLTESFDAIQGDAMTGKIGDADIVVAKDGARITLESIRVPMKKREKGQANTAMKAITDKADELGLDITLRAVLEPSSDMKPQQLRDWYRKFGFSFIGNNGLRVAGAEMDVVKPVTESTESKPISETPQEGGEKESKPIAKSPEVRPQSQTEAWEMTAKEFADNEQKTWWLHSKVVGYDNNTGVSTVKYELKEPGGIDTKTFASVTKNETERTTKKYKQGIAEELHKDVIKQAISEGKPVPPEVLADYPDLSPQPETPAEKSGDGLKEQIKEAEKEVDLNPTEEQKKAGNYKKGHVTVQGFDITIENPKGSFRSGTDKDGNTWSVEMKHTYGYFKGSEGRDGDQIDVFIGDNPASTKIFVVDQIDPDTKEFDESKVMMGFNSVEEAKQGYLANYKKGWQGLGQITETTVEDFKTWLYDGAKQRLPFGDYKGTPKPITQPPVAQSQEKPKRFEAGKKLTEAEKKEVYRTMKDAYKINNRPYHIEEDQRGYDRKVWDDNGRDYMETSDITGAKIRWVITLPDGKIAHPTELYSNLSQGEIDHAQKNIEYHEMSANRRYKKVEDALKANNETTAVVESIDTALKNGFTFKKEYDSGDVGQTEPYVRIKRTGDNISMSVPEYHVNRGGTFAGQTEKDLITHRTGQNNQWFNYNLSEIDWERFYNEHKGDVVEKPKPQTPPDEFVGDVVKPKAETPPEPTEQNDNWIWWVRDYSTDPKQVKAAWELEVANNIPYNKLMPWQIKMLTLTVSPKSWKNEGDKNWITKSFAKRWLRKGSKTIDVIIGEELKNEGDNEITINDVVLFMRDVSENRISIRKTTDTQIDLERKYRELTGKSLKPSKAKGKNADINVRIGEEIANFGAEIDRIKTDDEKIQRILQDYTLPEISSIETLEAAREYFEGDPYTPEEYDLVYNYLTEKQNENQVKPDEGEVVAADDRQYPEESPEVGRGKNERPAEFAGEVISKPKPEQKIEDFGEKIEGARKDQIKKYFDKINLNGRILSVIFPKPDIQQLIDNGLSVKDAAGIKVAYEFAVADKKKGEEVMRFYAAYAKSILAESINLEFKNERYVFSDYGKSQIILRTQAYEKIAKELGNEYLSLDLTKAKIAEITEKEMQHYVKKPEGKYMVQYYVSARKYFNTLDEATDEFVAQIKANTTKDTVTYKHKLSIYRSLQNGDHFIAYQPSGKPIIHLKDGFKSAREAFDYKNTNEADLQTELDRILAEQKVDTKRTVTRLKYSNETARERVGKDWRNGKNISSKEFGETFGFRGVEFGNWVNQSERQVFMNNSYDSLMDLAQLLNIPPSAISLGGNLAVSFGSRGSGNAAAHYEPGRKIINLTKTQGLGALAHEWFHAIDNYFAGFGTGMDHMKAATASNFTPETRKEIKDAFNKLYDTFRGTDFRQRSLNLDMSKSKNYFSLSHEMAARAFENYVLNRLKESGQINDFIVNYISTDDWNGQADVYPYPIGEETTKISEAFNNLFETIETREEDGKTILFQLQPDNVPTDLDEVQKRAEEEFGLTNDFREAGFLMPNGKMLDFSEKRDGGNPGTRSLDHRNINIIDIEYLDAIYKYGFVRLKPEIGGFELGQPLTTEQKKVAAQYIREVGAGQSRYDTFFVEYIPQGSNLTTASPFVDVSSTDVVWEYDNEVNPSRVFADLSRYFNDGIKPVPQVRFQLQPPEDVLKNPLLSKDADFFGDVVFGQKYQDFLQFHENLTQMAQRVAEQTGTKIFVVKSAGELPAYLRGAVKRKNDQGNFAPALFYEKSDGTQEVWIISNQTRSTQDAGQSLLHEVVAHHGLRQLFGERYDNILRQVWAQMSDDTKIERFRTYLAGNREAFDRMSREDKLKLINNTNESQRFLLADEWLAKQAETLGDKTPSWVRRIFSQIRQLLRDVAGLNLRFTDADLKAMFTASRENLAKEAASKPVTGKFAGEVIFDKETLRHAMTLYHGTPHDFDKFSSDKIGTGEGAQAYGYGLYFTDLKDVAEFYADKLADVEIKDLSIKGLPIYKNYTGHNYNARTDGEHQAAIIEDIMIRENELKVVHQNPTWTIQKMFDELIAQAKDEGELNDKSYWDERIKVLKRYRPEKIGDVKWDIPSSRTLITATIHKGKEADQYDYLRWDKPVTDEQIEKIKKQADKEGLKYDADVIKYEYFTQYENKLKLSPIQTHLSIYADLFDKSVITFQGVRNGQSVYRFAERLTHSKDNGQQASLFLLRAGIDGIKYPAESRGDKARGFNYVVFDENAIEIEDKLRFQIIGEQGAQRLTEAGLAVDSINNLTIAKEMETAGKSEKEIWLATGWQKGKEGKWRMEIQDFKTKIKTNGWGKLNAVMDLDQVIDAPELFKAYPNLKNTVVFIDIKPENYSDHGAFTPGKQGVVMWNAGEMQDIPAEIRVFVRKENTFKSVLTHEVQHAVQYDEGLARGSNLERAPRVDMLALNNIRSKIKALNIDTYRIENNISFGFYIEPETMQKYEQWKVLKEQEDDILAQIKTPYQAYKQVAGETEARNAQTRLTYNDLKRAETMLSESEDVAREDQIVLMESVKSALDLTPETPQTETEAFKRWFGNSKVVDENGKPLVVYHGTSTKEDFESFSTKEGRNEGYYFAGTPTYANTFAGFDNKRGVMYETYTDPKSAEYYASRIMPVYLKMENPLITDDQDLIEDIKYWKNIYDSVKNQGYDGVMLKNGEQFFVFSPTQIKSATGNIGTFDETNPDIRFSLRADNFAIGKAVKLQTPDGIIDGEIAQNYRNTNINQFSVRFMFEGHENVQNFSKVTGLPYLNKQLKDKGVKVLLDESPDIRFSLQPPPPGIAEPYSPDELKPRDMFDTNSGKFETKFNHAVENVFDNMLAVKFVEDEVEKRGGKFNAHSRPYREENFSKASAQAEKEKFDNEIVMPYEKVLAEIQQATDLSYSDIWKYLVAKHAPERNRDLGKGENGVAAGSIDGNLLTDATAHWYIQQFEDEINKYDGDLLQKLWDARDKMTKFTLNHYLNSGMISREVYDKLTDPVKGWKDYVPYRGWKDSINDLFDYQVGEIGDAYNPFKKADGRVSESDDPTVYMISMGHTAILAGAKNGYKQQMANLILLNPEIADAKDLFWFKRVYRILDGEGNIVDELPQDRLPGMYIEHRDNGKITVIGSGVQGNHAKLKKAGGAWDFGRRGYTFPESMEEDVRMQFAVQPGTVTTKVTDIHQSRKPLYLAKQHEVDVFIRGERAIMVFADPKVAHALNRINAIAQEAVPYAQKYIGTPTRYLAQVLTSKNPAFWPVNMTRDIGYAWAWHAINSEQSATEFLKNIPIAIKASKRYLSSHTQHLKQKDYGTLNETDRMYERWRLAGGETSYFRLLDIEKLRTNVERDMKVLMGELSVAGKFNENVIKKASEWLGIYSQLSENISRFATYMTAYQQYRKRGIEDEEAHKRAVADSKNVTVNFDKYGRVTPLLKAFYLFIGPNLGGLYNISKLANKNRAAFAKGAVAFMLLGMASAEITRLLSPPDDDDPTKREYDTLNDFVKENYLVLPNPAWLFDQGKESFITIPMPQGFRALYAGGVIADDVIRGNKTIAQGFGAFAAALGDAFMPVSMNFTAMGEQGVTGERLFRPLMPDIAKPFYDTYLLNEDFAGRMITRTPFTAKLDERLPEYAEARSFNNPYIVMASKWLNKMGGGDDLRSATFELDQDGNISHRMFGKLFDLNPARMEYLLEQYTGGVGMEFNNLIKTTTSAVQKMTGDEDAVVDTRNIPVLRRFYRTASNESAFTKWYALKKEVDDHFYYMNTYKKDGAYEEYKLLRGNTYMNGMKRLVDRVEKQAGRIEDVIDWKKQNEESAKEYFDKMEEMYREALQKAEELKKQQQK